MASPDKSSLPLSSSCFLHKTPSSTYKVPSSRGGFLSAEPMSFALKFKPPTIAIIYEIVRSPSPMKYSASAATHHSTDSTTAGGESFVNANSLLPPVDMSQRKKKRRIHEIRVDDLLLETSTSEDMSQICDMLLARESLYLDPNTISKQQVIKLLQKLQEQMFPQRHKDINK